VGCRSHYWVGLSIVEVNKLYGVMEVYRVVEYGYRTRNQMFLLWILLFFSDVSCGISPVLSANAHVAGAWLQSLHVNVDLRYFTSPITHGSSLSSSSPPSLILLLVQSFILNLRLGFSPRHFGYRSNRWQTRSVTDRWHIISVTSVLGHFSPETELHIQFGPWSFRS